MRPVIWLIALALIAGSGQPSFSQSPTALTKQLAAITAPLVGRVGVAAKLIGSNNVIALNGDELFPMASVYKVPAAVAALRKVDAGQLSLNQLVEIKPDDLSAGDNVIATNFLHPGIQLSVANLIEAMITESDNTATDMVFDVAGGPSNITSTMRSLGITGMRIDRNTKELMTDTLGMKVLGTAKAVAEFARSNPDIRTKFAEMPKDSAYEADPRDQSTPLAMLELLMQIEDAKATSRSSRDFLLASMSRTRTGPGRLKGLLPRGTPVAHKTGTSSGVANDVGYITLPDGRRFIVVVFTKSSSTPRPDRDRAIAEVARTLFDYFAMQN